MYDILQMYIILIPYTPIIVYRYYLIKKALVIVLKQTKELHI